MKRVMLLFVLAALFSPLLAQEKGQPAIYTFVYNRVPAHYPVPLLGVVNLAYGDQANAQLGFHNYNEGTLAGTQLGFNCLTGNNFSGYQAGFLSTAGGSVRGVQQGFICLSGGDMTGHQAGFITAAGGAAKGVQLGFANIVGNGLNGAQVGFVNLSGKGVYGNQTGFINITPKLRKGLQLGFINVADTVERGVPLGFLNIVRHGRYQALELAYNETFPFTISYKLGVRALYTSYSLALSPGDKQSPAGIGLGLGTICTLADNWDMHIEGSIFSVGNTFNPRDALNTLTVKLAVDMGPGQLVFGPSAGFSYPWGSYEQDGPTKVEPVWSFYADEVDNRHPIWVGFTAGYSIGL